MEKSCAPDEEGPTKLTTIKKEALSDDIKEFAETAMNELLGWYGYSSHHPREERNPRTSRSHSASNSSGPESPKFTEGCGWCGKPVDESTGLSSAAAVFCSELCFSQSRRANFKKNKTCDWCRHVRHTVSYVDSQDGSSQLQFCSDKCLNQYKMHIFWRETRAHLEIHPHLHGGEESSGTLITPDLWMNKCKSPEVQSTSSPSLSPKPIGERQQTSPLPLITVAHPSKLMSQPPQDNNNPTEITVTGRRLRSNNKIQKNKNKKKSPPILPANNNKILFPDVPQDLRIRHTPSLPGEFPTSRLLEEGPPNVHRFRPQFRPGPHFPPPPDPGLFHRPHFNHTETIPHRKLLDGLLPPPTLLVPYPVVLPLPLPIPIPIPIPIPSNNNNNGRIIKYKESSSQTDGGAENGDEDENKSSQVENSAEDLIIEERRPLRKRKRLVDKNKSNHKVAVKRKTLSV